MILRTLWNLLPLLIIGFGLYGFFTSTTPGYRWLSLTVFSILPVLGLLLLKLISTMQSDRWRLLFTFLGAPVVFPVVFGLVAAIASSLGLYGPNKGFASDWAQLTFVAFCGMAVLSFYALSTSMGMLTKSGSVDGRYSQERDDFYVLGRDVRDVALRVFATSCVLVALFYFGGVPKGFLDGRFSHSAEGAVTAQAGLNIRSAPNQGAPLLGFAPAGATLSIVNPDGPTENIGGIEDKWCEVKLGAIQGWAFCGYIKR